MSGHTPWAEIKRQKYLRQPRPAQLLAPVPGETAREARLRRQRNIDERQRYDAEAYERCGRCPYLRINVRHNVDPADQLEGPDYYADITDLHVFEPAR